MSFTTTAKSVPVDPYNRSEHVGILISRGGVVTLDSYFTIDPTLTNPNPAPEMSKFLVVDTAGVLVFKYFDGNYDFIQDAVPGFFYPVSAVQVVSSHTFTNGGLKTTTATGIHWYGGV